MKKKQDKARLYLWQDRFRQAKDDYQPQLDEMNKRDRYYNGCRDIYGPDGQKAAKGAATTRNIIFELIESQVESTFPTPKVTPYRPEDEERAVEIEDMLRNEMDRLPTEYFNDTDERTTPIQGGNFYLVEWDSSKHTHTTLGELSVQLVHPRKVIPQKGVESLQQSDWVFIELAQTKAYIKRRYGVDVTEEDENSSEIRGEGKQKSDDMVTQVIVYYRNEDGGIGLFSWVNDIVVEDLEDYQARVQKYCPKCDLMVSGNAEECPYCGYTKLQDKQQDYYELDEDVVLYDENGQEYKRIPAMSPVLDDMGNPIMEPELDDMGNPIMDVSDFESFNFSTGFQPRMKPAMEKTKIPYYKPDIFPLVLRKNVSIDGKFLGNSDIDFIKDQQNEINKYMTKITEKTQKGGSVLVKHSDLKMRNDDEEMKIVNYDTPEQAQGIRVYNLQADFSGDMQMAENNYNYARQVIGITDSFQGRRDVTATSGKAKEFSAAQAAGRFESKKTMKRAAYAMMYELLFKFMLAYADEPRNFKATDKLGRDVYRTFNKYAFLEQDAAGEWYWNDRFMFSTDNTGNLSQNREALWQEARGNFESGSFGDPTDINVRIMYWTMMKEMHYPFAATVLQNLEQQKEQQEQMMQQQMAMQQQQQAMMGGQPIQ